MLSSRTSYNFNLFQFGNKKKKKKRKVVILNYRVKLQNTGPCTYSIYFLLNHHTSFCVLPCSSKHTKKVVCIVQLPSLQKRSKIDFLIFLERPAKPNSGTNMFGRLLGKAEDIWRSDSISHSYLSLTMKHLRRLQSLALNSDRTLDYLIQNLCSIHLQIVSPHYL